MASRTGLVLAATLAACVAVAGGVQTADGASYGLLGHYEICEGRDYAFLHSIAVRENVFVGVGIASDSRVVGLSQGGHKILSLDGTGQPDGGFREPIVGASPAGALYVISGDNPPRLFKFAGGGFEREFRQDQGNQGIDGRLRAPVGLIATAAGSRGSTGGQVFVADSLEGVVIFEADGTFSERSREYAKQGDPEEGYLYAEAYPVGIAGVRYALAVPWVPFAADVTHVTLLTGKPLRKIGNFDVGDDFVGIAGAPDDTWWILRGSPAGLEHYSVTGSLIERVPTHGGHALSVAPDGKIWVARSDGLLRIGQGGGSIPPDQYGAGKCGPPRVQVDVPGNQQVVDDRRLIVAAKCNEKCTVRPSGTLSVPGGASATYKLRSRKRRLAPGDPARLKLRLSRKAANALDGAIARGQAGTVNVTLRTTDAAKTKSAKKLRLTIGG